MLSYPNIVVWGLCGPPLMSQKTKTSAFGCRGLMFRLSWAHRVLVNYQVRGRLPHDWMSWADNYEDRKDVAGSWPEIRPGGLQLVDLEGSAEIGQAQLQKGECVSKLTVLQVTPDSQLNQGNDVSGAVLGLSVTGLSPGQELAGDLPAAPDGNHF